MGVRKKEELRIISNLGHWRGVRGGAAGCHSLERRTQEQEQVEKGDDRASILNTWS